MTVTVLATHRPLWLFLDMNSYFAGVEQQERPELRGRPVGIVPVLAETTSFIAASYEAKMYGIRTGTGVAEARARCPHIQIVEARPRLYRSIHERIVEAVETVAPIHAIWSVDEMLVQPWGNETTLADGLRLGQQVQDAIRFGVGEWLSCSVGLAPSPFLAKVASDFQKPRGLSVICPDDIPGKLLHLRLLDWPGIGRGMEARFHRAGVTTTEQMYRLSVAQMRAIFGGIVGERWWHQIRGDTISGPAIKRWQIGHSNVLSPEFRNPVGAWAVISRLLEKAAARLRAEGFCAGRLSASAKSYTEGEWARRVRFQPTDATQDLRRQLKRLWQGNTSGRGCGLQVPRQVSISLQEILPREQATGSLFEDGRNAKLDAAMDAINRRYGRTMLTSASALAAKADLDHGRISFGKPVETY